MLVGFCDSYWAKCMNGMKKSSGYILSPDLGVSQTSTKVGYISTSLTSQQTIAIY